MALWVTWSFIVAPAPTFLHLGVHFCVFLGLSGTLGLQFGTPGRHFGDLGTSIWCLFSTLGRALAPFRQFWGKDAETVPKITENGIPEESIFSGILRFCSKCQTAFGLRLRGRIGVRASCFHSLSLHWCPLFFQCFFCVFWGPPGTSF